MKRNLPLLCLLLTALAAAQTFGSTAATLDEQEFEFDAPPATIVTVRDFSITEEANITAQLVHDLGDDFAVDLAFSDDGTSFTTVATGVNDTAISPEFTVNGTAKFRATIHVLGAAGLEEDTTDQFEFVLVLNTTANQGGNGGTQNPSTAHGVSVYWYNATRDSDADGLPDDWETENFGDLTAEGGGDADSDGFTNSQEYEAGSDPNNPSSQPETELFGGGGGSVTDRDGVHWLITLAICLLIVALVAWLAGDMFELQAAGVTLVATAALVISTIVVFFLDVFVLDGANWEWYSKIKLNWEETGILTIVFIVAMIAATIGFLNTDDDEEHHVAIWTFVGTTLVMGGLYAWFYFKDVNTGLF
ncbi:MAG: hypothetical protein ACPHK8_06955 [Thermoplasmatota archaeon]